MFNQSMKFTIAYHIENVDSRSIVNRKLFYFHSVLFYRNAIYHYIILHCCQSAQFPVISFRSMLVNLFHSFLIFSQIYSNALQSALFYFIYQANSQHFFRWNRDFSRLNCLVNQIKWVCNHGCGRKVSREVF